MRSDDNTVISADNTMSSTDNTMISDDKTVILADYTMLSVDNTVLSAHNTAKRNLIASCYNDKWNAKNIMVSADNMGFLADKMECYQLVNVKVFKS
jgi:hypothetical protein